MNGRLLAQIAAFFLLRAESERRALTKLVVVKLMYLADRLSLERSGAPISYDFPYSMEHGPILSTSLNLMNGDTEDHSQNGWSEWIELGDDNRTLSLARKSLSESDLDELSTYDRNLLAEIWVQFGPLTVTVSELYDYCHKLPEWEDPGLSSIPIALEDLFSVLGISADEARDHIASIRNVRLI